MNTLLKKLSISVTLTLTLAIPSLGATPFQPPSSVPGKEYSNYKDKDKNWNSDPMQNLGWDGLGANRNAADYTISLSAVENGEVDALAHSLDALFQGVVNNTASVGLLTSLTSENHINSHDSTGVANIWATPGEVRGAPAHTQNADDVDGLEIWGSYDLETNSYLDDADHFSLVGDMSNLGGTSVFYFDKNSNISSPYISHTQLLGQLNNFLHADFSEIDLDAMMLNDMTDIAQFEQGDSIMFSVAPIMTPNVTLDGGEIFVWENGVSFGYLTQGGVTWDTINNVAGIFNSNSENINALEAIQEVPEPTTCVLLMAGAAMLQRRRKRNG